MLTHKLKKAGYEDFFEANLEDPSFALPGTYDCAVLLHVLEHLFEPEEALKKIADGIVPGGSLIGGFPVVPGLFAAAREKHVRRHAGPMGHVSVFSPARVKRMAREAGLVVEFYTGAFFLRSKGSPLENSMAWMRFNLFWGRLFPGWPGEIYWLMRKPG
jgi:SAM-dependent methyltransferase